MLSPQKSVREASVISGHEIDSVPDRPAVFVLRAGTSAPYLARTSLLRRRLKRVLRMIGGEVDQIEYWLTGSQLESTLLFVDLAKQLLPDQWRRITRLRPPVFLRVTTENEFPRTLISSKFGRGTTFGPLESRAAAERFEAGVLDLFQVRRCEENLIPSLDHPGCMYGEMGRCLRPCQAAVSIDEYRGEVKRLEAFLQTEGASLRESAESARDAASSDMRFEDAARLHERVERIKEVQSRSGELARPMERLWGAAIVGSAQEQSLSLFVMAGGSWTGPIEVPIAKTVGAGQSLDAKLRETAGGVTEGSPDLEHLSILSRWHGSSWRDGEWVAFDAPGKFPYRRLINAISRYRLRQAPGPTALPAPAPPNQP